jgi:pantoate--beta-alanine ligase
VKSLFDIKTLAEWVAVNRPFALVPTMGALHEGHMALVQLAKQHAQRVMVSIFVNPTQFGPNEDLARYPRTLEADLAKCLAAGVDAVFCPTPEVMYPHGTVGLTQVTPPAWLVNQCCGASRPGHFEGVATVVLKLLNLVQPQVAVFGQKDAQQLAVIQHMVADLNLPVDILAAPTVRETAGALAGVALSSRNRYLTTPVQQQAATVLSKTLHRAAATLALEPETTLIQSVLDHAWADVLADLPDECRALVQLDYLAAVHADTFRPQAHNLGPLRLLAAAKVGEVRLIDNVSVS